MSKQPEMVIARNSRATRNNDTTLNLDNQMYQQPVTSFQRVSNDAPLSEETKTAIQNTVLQFYVHSQPQEEAEGITACYERLSQEDKLDGESNSISNQELLCRGWFLPPNTYDCGSFVVNGTAVVGKEPKKPYNRCKSTQKGAELYEISI